MPKPVVSDFYMQLVFNVNQMQSIISLLSEKVFQLQEFLMPGLSSISEDEAEGEKL